MKTYLQKTLATSSRENLLQILLAAKTSEQLDRLLNALFTPAEIRTFCERVEIFEGLLAGKTQRTLAAELKASLATISRGNRELQFGDGILEELFADP